MAMEEKRPGIFRRFYRGLMKVISALRLLVANLLFVVFLGLLFIVFSSSDLPSLPKKGALVLDIEGSLVDQQTFTDPLLKILGEDDPAQQEVVLQDVIDAINYAEDDPRITTLVLALDQMVYGGISKMQEISPSLQAFRESGKKIIAIGDYYSQDQYWLAAQADEIYLHPMGAVLLDGYGVYRSYYKKALDKLAVTFHVFRVGEYKSAMEPYIRDDMSTEAKKSNLVWLTALWKEYTKEVTTRRQLSADAIDQYINNIDQWLEQYQGNTASVAVALGLVDGIKTRDEINDYLVAQVGADDKGAYSSIGYKQYLWLKALELPKSKKESNVGLIVASGQIVDGEQPAGKIGGDTLVQLIQQARGDDSIKTVVLRVDSGGGSAFASEVIRRELTLLQNDGKPLIVSMGSVAASGGYWISAFADEIWAMPTTITGSIGIYGAFPTIDKSLAKVGVTTDGVGTTHLAGALRVDRPLQPIAARAIQSTIEHGYSQFLNLVAEGRAMEKSEVAKIAEGRVWSGIDAQRLGLVDQLGGLEEAIQSAAAMAGLDDFDLQLIEIPLTPQQQFLKEITGSVSYGLLRANTSSVVISQVQQLLQPFKASLDYLETMNDPRGMYSYCIACVAP